MMPTEPEQKGPEASDVQGRPADQDPRYGVALLAAIFLIAIVARVLDISFSSLNHAIGLILLAAFAFFVIFSATKSFLSLRKNLGELMATIVFGCAVSAVASLLWEMSPKARALVFAIGMAWSFAGSSWAWSNMERFAARTPKERFYCLCRGWIGVAPLVFLFALSNPDVSATQRIVLGIAAFCCFIYYVLDVRRY